MRCAWTWASSCGGVSQSISIFMWFFAPSSLAAASAPVRAARNTGLSELFAMTAMRIVLSLCVAGAGAGPAAVLDESCFDSFEPHASASTATIAERNTRRLGIGSPGPVDVLPPKMAIDTADTTLKPLTAFLRLGRVASLARRENKTKEITDSTD